MEPVPGATAASPAVPNTAASAEPAESVAEISTAAAPKKALSDLTADERHEWRKSGKLPDAPAASSTATATAVPPAGTPATLEPVSDPADDDPDYKPKTAARIKDLLTKISTLEAAARKPAAAPPAASAASAPAPAASASTLTEPDPETFQYGTADPAYLKALTIFAVAKAHEEQQATASKAAREAASVDAAKRIQESWKTRVAAASVKHADFEAVALASATAIPQGSLIDSWILESEHGAEVLYDLQKNPAEVHRLLALTPLAQTRELVKLEERLLADQPKLVTTAPEPGQTLTARGADPLGTDPVRRAVRKRDAGAYIKEANERDLAGRRRK